MQTIKAATFLLFADHVAAFIANAPAWATSGLKEQARMSSLRQLTPTGARSSRRGDLSLSSRNGAPSWRYEVDDLIKAASPWGSIVEAEIIATDLFKVWDRLRSNVTGCSSKCERFPRRSHHTYDSYLLADWELVRIRVSLPVALLRVSLL